jgi:ABC-type uncharacterized transport system substrate-binding protein
MKRSCLFILTLAFLAVYPLGVWAAGGKVLVVHSYHEMFDWVKEVNTSLRSVLDPAGVRYQFFYLDTKRKPTEAQIKAAALRARHLLIEYRPGVVIAVDDNAQAYFAKDYINKRGIQIVFCGVNADPQKYGYPAANATGILERSYPIQTLHVLKVLLPDIGKVVVVSDVSTTSDLVLPRIKKLAPNLSPGMVIVGYEQPATFPRWQKIIIGLDQNPQIDALLIPLYHTVRKEGAPTSVASAEVMHWTITHTQKPVVGLWPQNVTDGALLAVTVNPHEHGRVAAQMALQILNGKNAGDIPVMVNKEGYVMVNLRNKEHLVFDAGINIDQIADRVIR